MAPVLLSELRARPSRRLPPSHLPLPVVGADLTVPLVTGEEVRYVNLDYAASAPCLRSVLEAIESSLPWYSSVHRGAGFASSVMTELYASARSTVAEFVGARREDTVVFTRNTTDALNLLASVLPEETTVVTFASEHHANLLPWRRHRVIHLPVPRSHGEAIARAEEALRSIAGGPKLLAASGASNVTGELWPLEALGRVAREHDARFVVDAAQLAPHRRIDMDAIGADYLALSGHKLYAPFGVGALVGRTDWLDGARPYLQGGGAVKRVTLDDVEFVTGAGRHEAGTPNVLGAASLAAACRAIAKVGIDAIVAHEEELLDRVLRGLEDLPDVTVLSMFGRGSERIGVVTFEVKGVPHGAIASALSAEHGVGVRNGAFCAHPLLRTLVAQSEGTPGAVRASFGAGTRVADIERFLLAIRSIVTEGPRWRYRIEENRYLPDPDPRPRPQFPRGLA